MSDDHGSVTQLSQAFWQQCKDTHVANPGYYLRVKSVLPLLCELLLKPTDVVLDFGCGNGEYSAIVAQYCRRLDGYDLSPSLIDKAQAQKLANAQFVAGGVEALSDASAQAYDAIFMMGVSVTLHGDVLGQAVDQLGRLVRPGGVVVTRDSVTAEQDVIRQVRGDYHAHYRSLKNFVRTFEDRGLTCVRAVYLETFGDLNNFFFVFRKASRG